MKMRTKIICMVSGGLMLLGLGLAGVCFLWTGGNVGMYVNASGVHTQRTSNGADRLVTEKQDHLEGLHRVEIDVDFADIELIPSDHFELEYSYRGHNAKPRVEIKNGELLYQTGHKNGLQVTWFEFPSFHEKGSREVVKLFYPKDQVIDTVYLSSGNGRIIVQGLYARELNVTADFGKVELEKIKGDSLSLKTANGETQMKQIDVKNLGFEGSFGKVTYEDVKADLFSSSVANGDTKIEGGVFQNAVLCSDFGKIQAQNSTTSQLSIESGNGKVEWNGTVTGQTDIKNDFGKVELNTSLPKDQYSYQVEVDFGSIKIDGEKMGSPASAHASTANNINVEDSNGDVEITFGK